MNRKESTWSQTGACTYGVLRDSGLPAGPRGMGIGEGIRLGPSLGQPHHRSGSCSSSLPWAGVRLARMLL